MDESTAASRQHEDGDVAARRPRFVIRTIRDGAVQVFGETYKAVDRHVPYDGRLDGQRWAFAIYPRDVDYVGLWGSEAAYRGEDDWDTRPDVIDGYFVWTVWRRA